MKQEEKKKATLFNLRVFVDEQQIDGGSFRQGPNNTIVAYNGNLLSFFFKKLQRVYMPHYIDIGANTGAFTLLAAHIPHAKVYSIEPNPRIRAALEKNCELNSIPAVILPYAVWNRRTELTFYEYKQHGQSRVEHEFSAGGGTNALQIEARTLDGLAYEYHISRCDFMKIDVEGAELHVLQGAEGLIEVHHPAIFLEWWPPHCEVFGYHPRQIDEWLAKRGYSKQEVGHYAYYTQEE